MDKHGIDLKHDLFVVEAQLMSDIQIWAKMQHRQGLGQELALHLLAQLELHKYSLCIKPTLELHGTVATP